MKKTICAVCGKVCGSHFHWEREKDGKIFSVCLACAEANDVNAESVNNFEAGLEANSYAEWETRHAEMIRNKSRNGNCITGYRKMGPGRGYTKTKA